MHTTHRATVLLDSVSPAGARLTTLEVTMPRIVLCEFSRHRMFSFNSASSRAIPVGKFLQQVEQSPYIPQAWGTNRAGMVAGAPLGPEAAAQAEAEWLAARDAAVARARRLVELGVHKETTNRLLETFAWVTVVVSSTTWSNFFAQRCAADAHPDIRAVAVRMQVSLAESTPVRRYWHMPLLPDIDALAAASYQLDALKKISVARCARVSYLNHDGVRDPQKDLELYWRLAKGMHYSPLEHVACWGQGTGNFQGWDQYRHLVAEGKEF